MSTVTPAIQMLARRLIAHEAARRLPSGSGSEVVRVCDKLRVPLVKLAGVLGFRTLLKRAVGLAAADEPWLLSVQVLPDGALAMFDEARPKLESKVGVEPGTGLVAHLIGLLVTFIGEPLTLRLVRDAWPDADMDGKISEVERQP